MSLKKIHEIVVSPRVQVRVYKDSKWGEYQIRTYRDGKFREAETGYDNDRESAIGTARAIAGGNRNNPTRYRHQRDWEMLFKIAMEPGIRVARLVGESLPMERSLDQMQRDGLVQFADDTITRPLAGPNVYLTTKGRASLEHAAQHRTSVGYYGAIRRNGTKRRRNPNTSVANEILRQLGGSGRLGVMVGAHTFTADTDHSLTFRIKARAKKGIRGIRIVLEPSDTYRVEFWSIRGATVKEVAHYDGVYVSELIRLLERETGLAFRL